MSFSYPKTLADYPFVIVRLDCSLCPRRGRYRLARLVARYGPDADVDLVRRDLAKPCPLLENKGSGMRPACHVSYPDLQRCRRPPPDVPHG